MLYKIIGTNIRAARKKARITQAKLAEVLNVSPSHYSGMECGKKRFSLAQIVTISRYLHVPLSVLLSVVDEVEVKPENTCSELPLPVQEAAQEFCFLIRNYSQEEIDALLQICRIFSDQIAQKHRF